MRLRCLLIGVLALGCDPPELPQVPLEQTPEQAELNAPSDAPPSPRRTPDADAFTALFGEVLALRESPSSDVGGANWLAEAVAPGTAPIGLQVGPPPRTFPLTRTLVVLPRGAPRELAVTPEATVLCVGDRVRLRVPAEDPQPEWVEAAPGLDGAPSLHGDSAAELRLAEDAPGVVSNLAPMLRMPRSSAGAGDTLVTYWLTASALGVVPIALPLMYATPELEVLRPEATVEARVDLTGAPRVAPIQMSSLRVGDLVGVRYLRP